MDPKHNLTLIKGMQSAPKTFKSKMDTVLVTPAVVDSWHLPPFQRPLKVNKKVLALAEGLKENGGVIPGVLTLGRISERTYLVDGQHRIESFKLSGLNEGYADVRLCDFESFADMGEAFVNLQERLVAMKPDDVLRGLEGVIPLQAFIRKQCKFVGYDQLRRGPSSPIVSMSAVLRAWAMSSSEVPTGTGHSAIGVARELNDETSTQLVQFLNMAYGAWGGDPEYYRLWGSLNMTMSMWLWRRLVLTAYSQRSIRLTANQFGRCLMAMSADQSYLDWLVGRNLNERDRSPCYGRIRRIFVQRLSQEEDPKKIFFPAPAWYNSNGTNYR